MKNPPITAEAIERERYFRLCSEHIKQMERSLSHRYYSPAEKADLETLIDFYTAAREIFRTRGAPSDLGRFPQSAEKPTHSDRRSVKAVASEKSRVEEGYWTNTGAHEKPRHSARRSAKGTCRAHGSARAGPRASGHGGNPQTNAAWQSALDRSGRCSAIDLPPPQVKKK